VVLVSAMIHGANQHRLKRVQQELAIDRRTLKRWRQWWTQIFAQCAFWTAERGRFREPMALAVKIGESELSTGSDPRATPRQDPRQRVIQPRR
jgi:hypothetical protein